VVSEDELHPSFNGSKRTTQFSYLGLGGELTEEQQSNGGGVLDTKDYTYDAYGHRLSQTVTGPALPNGTSTYGYDVHGSVSQLIDSSGSSTASYGYKAYGQTDSGLTRGDGDQLNPLNPFRYSAKHQDTGSGTLDMGARRFGPDTSRFLTPDLFYGALSNLSLSLDPITQNRYGLAGGNPISFKEWDGHMVLEDGGGGAATDPSPSPPGESVQCSQDGGLLCALSSARRPRPGAPIGVAEWEGISGDSIRWFANVLTQARFSTGTWIIAIFHDGAPYRTPQEYTYSGMSYNGRRGNVVCSAGTWTITVTVERGTSAEDTITVSENECEPETEKTSKPGDLLNKLLSLVPKPTIGTPLPLPWPW
jgi:RHS repeat-associated protein